MRVREPVGCGEAGVGMTGTGSWMAMCERMRSSHALLERPGVAAA